MKLSHALIDKIRYYFDKYKIHSDMIGSIPLILLSSLMTKTNFDINLIKFFEIKFLFSQTQFAIPLMVLGFVNHQ